MYVVPQQERLPGVKVGNYTTNDKDQSKKGFPVMVALGEGRIVKLGLGPSTLFGFTPPFFLPS